VDGARIEKELLTLTDWHTDDLFVDAARDDHLVTAGFSRIFCDVERFADDHREVMSKFGMGVLYETTDDGEPMRDVTPKLRKEILERYYRPHHARLEKAVEAELDRVARAVIVDAHSFPDTPLKRDLDQRRPRPDFNIGTDPFHTPQELVDASVRFFEERGYSLGVDWPYKGTIVPLAWYEGQAGDVHHAGGQSQALFGGEYQRERQGVRRDQPCGQGVFGDDSAGSVSG